MAETEERNVPPSERDTTTVADPDVSERPEVDSPQVEPNSRNRSNLGEPEQNRVAAVKVL